MNPIAASTRTLMAFGNGFQVLQRLARLPLSRETCDFCRVPLTPRHRHLLEIANRKMICACDPCALRFQNVVGGRFKLVPRDARLLHDFAISDAAWDSLALPINLAFFFLGSTSGKITAMYPSPAGATESLLPLDHWCELIVENPRLEKLEPDVEALLVNRVRAPYEYYSAPIDACFELVGLIRTHWRGLSGGEAVWREIGRFFDRLRSQTQTSTRVAGVCHA